MDGSVIQDKIRYNKLKKEEGCFMKPSLLDYLMRHARTTLDFQLLAEQDTQLPLLPQLHDLSKDYSLEIKGETVIFHPDAPLSKTRLKTELSSYWPTISTQSWAILPSTNTFLKEQLSRKELKPQHVHLVVADKQTQGRGRLGRSFVSSIYNGLYLSVYLPFEMKDGQFPPFTLIAAAALTQAIESLTSFAIVIKWVNDLYYKQKKIAGILTETTLDTETNQINGVIIGVGLNLSCFPDEIPLELKEKMGSLFKPGEERFSRHQLITTFLHFFHELLTDDTQRYYSIYREHSIVLGKRVSFLDKGQLTTGIATDISPDGALTIQLEDQSQITLMAGEISLLSY